MMSLVIALVCLAFVFLLFLTVLLCTLKYYKWGVRCFSLSIGLVTFHNIIHGWFFYKNYGVTLYVLYILKVNTAYVYLGIYFALSLILYVAACLFSLYILYVYNSWTEGFQCGIVLPSSGFILLCIFKVIIAHWLNICLLDHDLYVLLVHDFGGLVLSFCVGYILYIKKYISTK